MGFEDLGSHKEVGMYFTMDKILNIGKYLAIEKPLVHLVGSRSSTIAME
jgi:hypothetical protein